MIELLLIKSLFERDTYRKYRHYIKVSEELQPVLDSVDLWYRNNTENPKLEDLAVAIFLNHPKDQEYLQDAVKRLERLEIPKDIGGLLASVKTAQTANKLALEAHKLSGGHSSVSNVIKLAQQLEKPDEQSEVRFVSQDLREILSTTTGNTGLRWRLPWLNKSLGSLRKGDFGFVFARPETGKTTFLSSECTYMAGQLSGETGPILWFNNEEQGSKVQLRCYQSSLGATLRQITDAPDRAEAAYTRNGGRKIRIVDDANLTYKQIEALCHEQNPSLIVFDQIDKIKGFKNDREDLALGALYQWARELSKQYCPIIGVCQASGEAEGVPYLHMGHVANARTSKQAEADFILGIGKTHDFGAEFTRYFSICKNKLVGDQDTDPTYRHSRQDILIKPDIGRYIEV